VRAHLSHGFAELFKVEGKMRGHAEARIDLVGEVAGAIAGRVGAIDREGANHRRRPLLKRPKRGTVDHHLTNTAAPLA
jgi:hypothetical protein